MRILLTGGSGQVGRAFQELATAHEVVAPAHGALPIEDAAACERVVSEVRPDWIVHPAAMTDVDACERHPTRAHAINALGAENLASVAARHGARMLLVSTDYVFDGTKGHYQETDPAQPISHYGRSKLEGERLVQAALPAAIVARTSVVFGPHKNNFVQWVRRSLREGSPVKAARDQWVTPTAAHDVACQCLVLIEAGETGIWHTAGAERLSRLEMAMRIAAHEGLDPSPIQAVSMDDLSWVAQRPRDSSLDTGKISGLVHPWRFDRALETLGAAA
jgi:dTDP-4-dehydrorhamnose reductase